MHEAGGGDRGTQLHVLDAYREVIPGIHIQR